MISPVAPHLINLNEDPQITLKLTYSLEKTKTIVGRKKASPKPDIILESVGIQVIHAVFTNNA